MNKQYQDEAVCLRKISSADTAQIVAWRNSEFVRCGCIRQDPFTADAHEKWLKNEVDTGHVAQFILEDKILGRDVGSVYLRDIDPVSHKAEYGIFIGEKDACGRGIGTRATKLTLRYAFEVLKLHKVFLHVFAENGSAIRSYEKAGFVQEGCFKDDVYRNGRYHDLLYMSVIDSSDRVL
ncbi:MAG: GNAT family protein [Ruthenibacterium sp.]